MTTPKKRLPGQTEKLWIRIRIFVEGRQVDDSLLILGPAGLRDILGDLGQQHGELCRAAELTGRPYLVEFEFWDGEFVRWGTDPERMAEPIPMKAGLAALLVELERRWGLV
jgi:hypothetical protein